MTHLSPAEFVDEVEGRLPEARRSHLEICAACTDRITAAREAIERARSADIPEPSPLFWQHFADRVHQAVRHDTPERAPWWRRRAWAIPGTVGLVAVVLVGVRDVRVSPVASVPALPVVAQADATPRDDPAWNLLTDVASTMEQENPQAAPLTVRPSDVDRAVVDLSPAERQELRRLLEDEMKRSGD
jgi:hypothetical protein